MKTRVWCPLCCRLPQQRELVPKRGTGRNCSARGRLRARARGLSAVGAASCGHHKSTGSSNATPHPRPWASLVVDIRSLLFSASAASEYGAASSHGERERQPKWPAHLQNAPRFKRLWGRGGMPVLSRTDGNKTIERPYFLFPGKYGPRNTSGWC